MFETRNIRTRKKFFLMFKDGYGFRKRSKTDSSYIQLDVYLRRCYNDNVSSLPLGNAFDQMSCTEVINELQYGHW